MQSQMKEETRIAKLERVNAEMQKQLEKAEVEFGAGLKNPWKWRIRKRIWV